MSAESCGLAKEPPVEPALAPLCSERLFVRRLAATLPGNSLHGLCRSVTHRLREARSRQQAWQTDQRQRRDPLESLQSVSFRFTYGAWSGKTGGVITQLLDKKTA